MNQRFEAAEFSSAIRTKRLIHKDIGLREAAKEIGISSSTLSRMENCKNAELDKLLLVSNWLKIPLSVYITTKPLPKKRK
jgi:DNA-binding Xre family transcriptional regulator